MLDTGLLNIDMNWLIDGKIISKGIFTAEEDLNPTIRHGGNGITISSLSSFELVSGQNVPVWHDSALEALAEKDQQLRPQQRHWLVPECSRGDSGARWSVE